MRTQWKETMMEDTRLASSAHISPATAAARRVNVGRAMSTALVAGVAALAASAAACFAASDAVAQVPWETPQLASPHGAPGVGMAAVAYGSTARAGLGMLVTWRGQRGPGLGFRGGVAEGFDGEITGFGGADVSAWLVRASADFPVDVIWTSGAGASFGRYFTAALPMGFSIGRVWSGQNAEFGPYVSARGVLEGRYGEDAPEEILALDIATELGGELLLGSGRGILFRVAASFGDRSALVLGIGLGSGIGR